MAKRTDVHCDTNIVPMDYEFVLWYDQGGFNEPSLHINCKQPIFDMALLKVIPGHSHRDNGRCCLLGLRQIAKVKFTGIHSNSGQCDICGACFRYGDVWKHRPTDGYIHVGHDCADKYSMIANREDLKAYRKAVHEARSIAAKEQKRATARDEFIKGHDMAKVFELRKTDEQIEAERKELNPPLHEPHDHHYGSLTVWDDGCPLCGKLAGDPSWEYSRQKPQRNEWDPPGILRDMYDKLHRYGSLSEKQIAFAHKLANQILNPPPPKPVERHVPAPLGRVSVRGTIVSVKHYDTDYGPSTKMTVKVETPNGSWLVWVTVPSSISTEFWATPGQHDEIAPWLKGKEVEFTATLTRGNDEHFAFGKRPSKARIVA